MPRCSVFMVNPNGQGPWIMPRTTLMHTDIRFDYHGADLLDIQRQARAMQAQVLADMIKALVRRIVALFTRAPTAHTA